MVTTRVTTGPLRRAAALVGALAVVGSLLSGCSTGDGAPSASGTASEPTSTSTGTSTPARRTSAPSRLDAADGYAVTTGGADLEVRDAPDGEVTHTLEDPRESGAPLTLLLAEDRGEWLQVWVPVRPNGSQGWVRRDDVQLASLPYRLEMSTDDNELALYEGDDLVDTFSAASGTGDTPTPLGTFFLTELIEPTNDGYGPYAYGLSGFSEVLSEFGGGPGQIGLHGTDDADSVGRAVSHGCIRLSDADITFLAETLPLGTPVVIT